MVGGGANQSRAARPQIHSSPLPRLGVGLHLCSERRSWSLGSLFFRVAEGVFSLQGAEQQEHGTGGDLPSPGMMTKGSNHMEASGTGLCGQASEAERDTPERPGESLEVGESLQHMGGTGNQQKACAVALVASFMHASGGHQGLGCLAKASDQCSLQRCWG